MREAAHITTMTGIESVKTVAVVGAGSWGTAVAKAVGETYPRIDVIMWALEKEVVASINSRHENARYLPGIVLPPSIRATGVIRDAVGGADIVLVATPSKAVYEISQKIGKCMRAGAAVGYLSKGFCKIQSEIFTISQTIERAIPALKGRTVAISGPSHAEEVCRRYHTCLNIGGRHAGDRALITALLSGEYLACREREDVIGVELGGTLKNPAAIAAGMISVLPACGDNLSGALISEALKEMIGLGAIFNVKPETMIDISGLGDLVATALSDHSRNRRFGKDIASKIMHGGRALGLIDRIVLRVRPQSVIGRMSEKLNYLAEGAYAIEPLIELAQSVDLPIPVYRSLYEVLMNKKDPSLLIETIKNPAKFEELYSKTKIHLSGRRRGLERLRGNVFKDIIMRKTMEKLIPTASPDPGMDREVILGRLTGCIAVMDDIHDRECKKELRIIDSMRSGDYASGLRRLVEHYVDIVTDRFSPFFFWIAVIYLYLCSLMNVFRGRRGTIAVRGYPAELKKAVVSAHVLYLAPRKGNLDFLYYLLAIVKKGLPVPRFYVPSEAVTGAYMRWLVRRAGGFIVDCARLVNPVYRETLSQYLSVLISNGIPLLYFPSFRPGEGYDPAVHELYSKVIENLYANTIEIAAVPVVASFDRDPGTSRIGDIHLGSALSGRADIHISRVMRLSEFTRSAELLKTVPAAVERAWGRGE